MTSLPPGVALRRAALEARMDVSAGRCSSRDAAERAGGGLPPRDRALLLNLVAGTTRHLLTLDHLLSRHLRRRLDRLDPPVRETLRLGAFQLAFCGRIPPHAAVDATLEAAKPSVRRGAGTVNAVLRALAAEIEGREPAAPGDDPAKVLPDGAGGTCRFSGRVLPDGDPRAPALLAVRCSLPAWLAARWVARLGPEAAEAAALASLAPPPLFLRPNPALGDAVALAAALGRAGIEASALPGGAVRVDGGDPAELPGWAQGAFSVQDPSAQSVVSEGVAPRPGERLLDLCAGVGGKTCALAEGTGPSGSVVAVDLSARRLERLKASAARLGLAWVRAAEGDVLSPGDWAGAYDAVLLDAPCTNTGVLRRRPEARWRLSPQDPARMAALQSRLLASAARQVAPGGRLVYSTCSVESEENEGVAGAFASAHPGFSREAERVRLPGADGDGGFWVRFRRDRTAPTPGE